MAGEDDERDPAAPEGGLARLLAALRLRPPIAALMGVLLVCGAVAGPFLLPDEWSVARRALGGALAGVGLGIVVWANRMFEAD